MTCFMCFAFFSFLRIVKVQATWKWFMGSRSTMVDFSLCIIFDVGYWREVVCFLPLRTISDRNLLQGDNRTVWFWLCMTELVQHILLNIEKFLKCQNSKLIGELYHCQGVFQLVHIIGASLVLQGLWIILRRFHQICWSGRKARVVPPLPVACAAEEEKKNWKFTSSLSAITA